MSLRRTVYLVSLLILSFLTILYGCETLKKAKPIYSIKEYERMIVGRLDADYVGTDNCLKACHTHDKIRTYFEASTMGAQLSADSGMPLVDCESCHGPGSLAIEGITPEKVEEDKRQGKQTACNYDTLLHLESLPAGAQSLICLKCHTAHALFNVHNWNASEHAQNDVSCSDCHPVHIGADLTTKPRDTKQMCLKCHQEIGAEFSMPSRHPVLEKKILCTDCHDPHGFISEKILRKTTVKETCTQCHAEKDGPFLYEHADITENCITCHSPHGSVNNNLLKVREPFLCLQCHMGHKMNTSGGSPSSLDSKSAFYTRCTDCHSQIHGTDIPSASGTGRFIQ